MKNTIVIGGGGFIGRYLTKILSEAGRKVYVVGRRKIPPQDFPREYHYISGDYEDRNLLKKILKPGSEVVDLAYSTVPKTSFENPLYDMNSNLPSSVGLMQEALKTRVCRIVLVSSGGTVYGPVDSVPITETFLTRPISPYGITKLAVEHYAMMYHRSEKLPVVVVRPGNAYGEGQRPNRGQGFIATAIDAILSNREVEIYGQQGTIRDYVHVSDVAFGLMAALFNGKEGTIYNLGTGIGTSNSEIISILTRLAEKDGYTVRTRILPARPYDVKINVLDSSRLKNDTSWSPKKRLKEGIQQMWNAAKLQIKNL